MDVVGSEIGQKMRSAIKAKLTELGCYVDDELPDYVMVMVANKRTRAQMEDDLQLFLGDNTELFVNWLHQVLKKLQEVTVTAPIKVAESEKSKDSSTKEKKSKDKKDKDKSKKSESSKKSKKKDKEKLHKKKDKESKKAHKSKKKSKKHEMIRPNIPPLLMNMEKESEPSITDVFAGQILKNHGITLETPKIDTKVDEKPALPELKRPILPIIDPATINSQPEPSQSSMESITTISDHDVEEVPTAPTVPAPRDEQIKEMNEIEAKIQGLKQKLAEQLDSMSDDEDFLTIRTEAEELMNDFAEDVYQEISAAAPRAPATPPLSLASPPRSRSPSPFPPKPPSPEALPQIELQLPKRPVRERLGAREDKLDKAESPERFTPEREPETKRARSRLDEPPEKQRKIDDDDDDLETSSKRISSKVAVLERTPRVCASVVRVRPRPRVAAPSNSLLLRAVADAHKSLLNIPPKMETEPAKVKRALVKPMRRCVDAQKIVIQVQADSHTETTEKADSEKQRSPSEKEEFSPALFTKKIVNTDYVPPRTKDPRTSSVRDDTLVIETLNIHNPTVDKQKDTQFIVTMDGYDPNVFLAKKLLTEGLLDDDDKSKKSDTDSKTKDKPDKVYKEVDERTETVKNKEVKESKKEINKDLPIENKVKHDKKDSKDDKDVAPKKRLSDTSEESDTQVIINPETEKTEPEVEEKLEVPVVRKRKKSPIVFDVEKKEKKDRARERTESAGSDNHVTVTTITSTHKYDSVPSLSAAERAVIPCRAFPACRYGSSCAFLHPRCKFAAACTRRDCVYTHTQPPKLVASHVVPAATFKTIQPSALPTICKFYPNCVNPACHFAHPKPCRYGKGCLNKAECNFYHADKWRYPV
ncbi:zinc finger CCCH domain-containing protein 14-like [Leguminivora glycinivorella]|uniref:zinc finger CCCH domain-containing protein 14-like n=1 Tax=Leguminivora glycinivorella TaxID=1035111 RepID=UPI0020102CC3|nr:zinc finger CCCH domain-containing protein 14-like [Leguminivora glycinivorella]